MHLNSVKYNIDQEADNESVQNFLQNLNVMFPKDTPLEADFWGKVTKKEQETTDQNTLPETVSEPQILSLVDDVVYIKQMFKKFLAIDLQIAHFAAAYKMIGGAAVDFVGCPSSYLSLVVGACWLKRKGVKSHLVYLNDELSHYRAESFNVLLESMNLSSATILPDMNIEQRTQAYQADITFCSMRELGLDYLRMQDNAKQSEQITVDQCQEAKSLFINPFVQACPEKLAVVLIEDIGIIMVDAMMTPLQISKDTPANTPHSPSDQEEQVIAVSSFNKIFRKLPRIGGVSTSLDQHTEHDLLRYRITQHTLQPFRATASSYIRVFNKEAQRIEALVHKIQYLIEFSGQQQSAHVCILDQFPPELSSQFINALSNSESTKNIKTQTLPLENVFGYLQSVEQLPKTGVTCVLVEKSLSNIPDVTDQYHRVKGVNIAVYSMGVEPVYRLAQKRSALLAGFFGCTEHFSFLTVNHFNKGESEMASRVLKKMPYKLNQWLLPKVVTFQQRYKDKQQRSVNKALLTYEQELDDLLAFSG